MTRETLASRMFLSNLQSWTIRGPERVLVVRPTLPDLAVYSASPTWAIRCSLLTCSREDAVCGIHAGFQEPRESSSVLQVGGLFSSTDTWPSLRSFCESLLPTWPFYHTALTSSLIPQPPVTFLF